jgi:phage/plasmid-like protein (TIGR03299 family)
MAYAGQTPWHGLGTKVDPNLSPKEMLKAAGLDWTVSLSSLSYKHKDKHFTEKTMKVLKRDTDGKRLSIVSKIWNPIQNHEAFEVFDSFVREGSMKMETAGSLEDSHGHTKVWGLARVEDSFEVVKNDVVQAYFLFSNPHMYGESANLRFTPVRVVCNNTLQLSLKTDSIDARAIKINHRQKFDPDRVKELLGISHIQLSEYRDSAKFLASKRYSQENLEDYFSRVFPSASQRRIVTGAEPKEEVSISDMAKRAVEINETQPGADFARGSWWQAFNTVTFIKDHVQGKSIETRLEKNWYGSGAAEKNNALKLALKMAA